MFSLSVITVILILVLSVLTVSGDHPHPQKSSTATERAEVKQRKQGAMLPRALDTSDFYNISYFKLQTNARRCLSGNQRAFADCVYLSQSKWEQLVTDIQDTEALTKVDCCAFWEAHECIVKLVVDLCPKEQSDLYIGDSDLMMAQQFLVEGYCSSYQQLEDCYNLRYYLLSSVSLMAAASSILILLAVVVLIGVYISRRRKMVKLQLDQHHKPNSRPEPKLAAKLSALHHLP